MYRVALLLVAAALSLGNIGCTIRLAVPQGEMLNNIQYYEEGKKQGKAEAEQELLQALDNIIESEQQLQYDRESPRIDPKHNHEEDSWKHMFPEQDSMRESIEL